MPCKRARLPALRPCLAVRASRAFSVPRRDGGGFRPLRGAAGFATHHCCALQRPCAAFAARRERRARACGGHARRGARCAGGVVAGVGRGGIVCPETPSTDNHGGGRVGRAGIQRRAGGLACAERRGAACAGHGGGGAAPRGSRGPTAQLFEPLCAACGPRLTRAPRLAAGERGAAALAAQQRNALVGALPAPCARLPHSGACVWLPQSSRAHALAPRRAELGARRGHRV